LGNGWQQVNQWVNLNFFGEASVLAETDLAMSQAFK
jgi:hypothetical protein